MKTIASVFKYCFHVHAFFTSVSYDVYPRDDAAKAKVTRNGGNANVSAIGFFVNNAGRIVLAGFPATKLEVWLVNVPEGWHGGNQACCLIEKLSSCLSLSSLWNTSL